MIPLWMPLTFGLWEFQRVSSFRRIACFRWRLHDEGIRTSVMTSFSLQSFISKAFGACSLLTALATAEARPDFEASEITSSSSSVRAGEVAHFKVWLRNQGDEPAQAAEVTLQWPAQGYLIEVTGLEDVQVNPEAGSVQGTISLAMKGERVVDVTVLAPREGAGELLSLSARLIHYHTMAETWAHGKIEIDSRPRTDGWLLGGLRITTAGVMSLGWLAATVIVLLLAIWLPKKSAATRFFGPGAGAFAIMIALGFWLIFAAMAWHDYQVLFHWKETPGTVVGRRVTLETVSTQQRLSSGATSQTRPTDVAKPEFAVRYQVDGRERLSTGYDTGSSLRVGGGKAQLEKEFREWAIGAQVPCWYDPADPDAIVLKRGFGGAYLFALLPLFPFWMGWGLLRRG